MKNNLFSYLGKCVLGVMYGVALIMIILSGSNTEEIVTNNVNRVKILKSERMIAGEKEQKLNFLRVYNTYEIKQYGPSIPVEFGGTLTGYGPDCEGCSGIIACSPYPNVQNGNIWFEDPEYGRIRIVAADRSIPCGSIINIQNYMFNEYQDFYAIVLDRGGAIVGMTMDLLYDSEASTLIVGRQRDINFQVVRWGY